MKLPSSTLIVYPTTYAILLALAIILNYILLPSIGSLLVRIYTIDFCITIIFYGIGNYLFSSNDLYDLHWSLLPLICSIYFYMATDAIETNWLKPILLIILIFLWSSHLLWQRINSSDSIYHEDWRYQSMRRTYAAHFQMFALFALHLLPMIEVQIGSIPIYYIFTNLSNEQTLTFTDVVFLLVILLGVLLENFADRQLNEFRQWKSQSRERRFTVLLDGLWKYSRHPNYLGELIFWWAILVYGYYHSAPWWCVISPLLITLMMIFGSIPITEERMFRKYPDYKFVQQRVPMLIPTFNIF